VASATDPHGRILGFLDRSRYYLTSPTSDGRSVGIVRLRPMATEYVCIPFFIVCDLEVLIPCARPLLYFLFPITFIGFLVQQ
jgi:hypothetical protein